MTKYNFNIDSDLINTNINRLTNQIWKLIPMWLNELFNFNGQYLILLSKLEGLKVYAIDFLIYRKTVFEAITLLRGLRIEE